MGTGIRLKYGYNEVEDDHGENKYEDEDEVQDDYNDNNVKLALDQCKR